MQPETTFTFTASGEQFSVDKESRVIAGLIVPFGVSPVDGRAVKFSKGEIGWSSYKSVKLNLDHDRSTSFGFGLSLAETEAGIEGKFKVADGPRGDEALALAESGVYDGLSVNLYRPEGKEKFHLTHVALTAEPAFDEARVSKIAASAATTLEGAHVMGDTTETAEAPQDFAAITEAIKQGFSTLTLNLPPRETTPAAPAKVKEASPYRFDGTKGPYDFSTDLFAGLKGEGAPLQRATDFINHTFAPVDSGDVTSVNPTGYRPDLYVDYIEKSAPVYSAIHSGGINDATPFVVPKFGSDTGLVSDHTEGVEPTEGTFTATSQTVTPTAVSGKAIVTREVIDAGGNPVVSQMIWRQMNRRYAEALETKAAALLNGAAVAELGTVIPIADETPADEVLQMLADAVFIDGSGEWDFFLGHRDLFSALAAAKDGQGRPLFPALNPSNANGAMASKFRSIDVNGWRLDPAASLGATNTNGKTFIGDKEGLLFVNSAPKRIDLAETVATVSFGLFGYVGSAVLDVNKVRKITYNAATTS